MDEMEDLKEKINRVRRVADLFLEHAAHITGHPWSRDSTFKEAEVLTNAARAIYNAIGE